MTEPKPRPLLIGRLAKLAGVKPDTVRYYERVGLLPKAERKLSGYRVYDQTSVKRLQFIKQAQSLAFSLDEIEKAHPRVLDVFLQILDAARVTMASGETLELSGFYIVFTSNIGSADLMNLQYSTPATMERHVLTRAQQSMRPELYARITEKLVFSRLTYDCQLEIAQLLLNQELEFLRAKGHELRPDGTVLPFLVRRGFHPKLGARPMRDAVEKLVGDAVAVSLLTGGIGCGKLVVDELANCLAIR